MKILCLINWKIKYLDKKPDNVQPSDYFVSGEKFWFFKYFSHDDEIQVIDIANKRIFEKIENKMHCHIFQNIKALKLMRKEKYDLLFCHGTDSAIFLGFLKRIFFKKIPPIIVVDISSFNKAAKKGLVHRLCKFSSKAFSHLIYHCSAQEAYFNKYFPWLAQNMSFIPFGVDCEYWKNKKYKIIPSKYIVCAGSRKRDWKTLLEAYSSTEITNELIILGKTDIEVNDKRVKTIKFLPIDEYNEIIVNSLFSIIPLENLDYSFGQMTLLQQMALGKVILCANSNAVSDYFCQSKGIIVYECGNIEDLKNKILQIMSLNENDIDALEKENISIVENHFSEEKMSREIYKICKKYVEEK